MAASLTEMTGDRKGHLHPLGTQPVTIGRSPDADVVIANSLISRQHARVWWDGERYLVEDLGTRNGTRVNRDKVDAPHPLEDGDEIVLPGMILVFRSTEETMMFAPTRPPRATTLSFLFTDLRGYTTYTEARGDAAAAELVAEYRAFVRAEIARAEGTEIKTEGDSFFVTFESATQAVRCALGILREAAARSDAHPDRPIRVGAGIHAGEPVRDDDGDFVGSAVNVAARLCSAAAAGELLVSEVVRGLVRTSTIAPMEERTGLKLKGVEDPPRIYAVATGAPAILRAGPAWATLSDVGRLRKGNEDAVAVLPPGDGYSSGAIVCDGMGGGAAGEVASRIAVELIAAALSGSADRTLAERVRAGTADANRAIREHAREKLDGAESGTTMVLALISGRRLTVAHVGDSRAYLLRAGRLEQLTGDHTFVAAQVREGLIPAENAASHPLRSRLTKSLGTSETAEADIAEHELRSGDVVLLCSDGLHDMVTDEEIAGSVTPDAERTARGLIDLANSRGGRDNVSVAVFSAPPERSHEPTR